MVAANEPGKGSSAEPVRAASPYAEHQGHDSDYCLSPSPSQPVLCMSLKILILPRKNDLFLKKKVVCIAYTEVVAFTPLPLIV